MLICWECCVKGDVKNVGSVEVIYLGEWVGVVYLVLYDARVCLLSYTLLLLTEGVVWVEIGSF